MNKLFQKMVLLLLVMMMLLPNHLGKVFADDEAIEEEPIETQEVIEEESQEVVEEEEFVVEENQEEVVVEETPTVEEELVIEEEVVTEEIEEPTPVIEAQEILNGFVKESNATFYYQNGTKLTGQRFIDGKWYYFNETSGEMITGFYYIPYQDKTVYYAEDGHMLYGQQRIDGKWYYFTQGTGKMITGFYYIPYQKKTVYYAEDGHMLYGDQQINKIDYTFDPITGALKQGWIHVYPYANNGEDAMMYVMEDGSFAKNQKKIDGSWYYFDDVTGYTKKGFYYIPYQDKTVYYNANGIMLYKQQRIDGYWYCFDRITGAMKTGFTELDSWYHSEYDKDKTVYYDENGRMLYGEQKIDDYYYYFNYYTGALIKGWVNIPASKNDGVATKAYTDSEGHVLFGQRKIDGNWYYFDYPTGYIKTGFVEIPSQNKTVYYDETGKMLYGKQEIDGKTYYFDFVTGALQDSGFVWISPKDGGGKPMTVYLQADGTRLKGLQKINGNTYYFDETTGAMQYGFVDVPAKYNNGKKMTAHFDENGVMTLKDFSIPGKYGNDTVYYKVDPNTGAITNFAGDRQVMYGIDISEHNGDFNFDPYKDGFVIIRIGTWNPNGDIVWDAKAKRNMDLCEQYGIPYGVYFYSYALNVNQAKAEAQFVINALEGRNVQLGVWFDMEDADGWKRRQGSSYGFVNKDGSYNATRISDLCKTFCDEVNNAGYHVGIYASYSWFKDYIKGCENYDSWVAFWGDNDKKQKDVVYEYYQLKNDYSGEWWYDSSRFVDIAKMSVMQQFSSSKGLDKNVMYVYPGYFQKQEYTLN